MKTAQATSLVVLTAISLAGCGGKKAEEPLPPRPVVTYRVTEPVSYIDRSFSGSTAVAGSVQFGFEIGGRIVELKAVAGRRYEKDEVLAQLDTASLQEDVRRAEAESIRAGQELGRVQQMYEADNASKGDLDAAIATQKSAEAALANAKRNVLNGTLRMPYDGLIGEVLLEVQDIVTAGTPVVIVQGEGPLEMEIGVPAELIEQVRPGMTGSIQLGSVQDQTFKGTVKEVTPRASQNTTYPVSFRIEPVEGVKLVEGMDGEATLRFSNPQGSVMTVPAAGVVASPGGSRYVWVVESKGDGGLGVVRKQEVEIGQLRAHGHVEILEGLEAGALVVSRGAHQLEPGIEVSMKLVPNE